MRASCIASLAVCFARASSLPQASPRAERALVELSAYADRENPMSSSITAPGPTGTLPGFGW